MSRPTSIERIRHMRDAISRIDTYVSEMSCVDFEADAKTQDAVISCLMILGEAVRTIDPDLLERYDYPWGVVRAFRNFIAHEYHAINMERVYHAANDLERLRSILDRMLETEFR
ncbi:MAG: DUF86 domain-containing protein [Candidatus Kapabacteria bacterium]|nr:DUF86 domain-containing protein [Candidatus Kapabacteria bacterium]